MTRDKESVCDCDTCTYNRSSKSYRRQRNRQRWKPYGKAQQAIVARLIVDKLLTIEWGKDSSRRERGNGYGVWGQTHMRAYFELKRMGYVADVTRDERNRYSNYADDYAAPYDDSLWRDSAKRYNSKPNPEYWDPHTDVRVIRLTTEAEREQFEADRKAKVEDLRKRKIAARKPATPFSDRNDTDKYKKAEFGRDPHEFWGEDYKKWDAH